MIKPNKINYLHLDSKAKESYNFAKIAAILADYGYESLWLNNDSNGADFLANHATHTLRLQLKGAIAFAEKYKYKDIYIVFKYEDGLWLYEHDTFLLEMPKKSQEYVKEHGYWSYNQIGPTMLERLERSENTIYLD